MSWKCPECGADVPNDTGMCLCGYDERLAVEQVKARTTTGRGKASAMDRMGKPREIGGDNFGDVRSQSAFRTGLS
jgi:hypothetical protein